MSVIESFDPETLRFQLREPHPMKVGDRFQVIAPSVNWLLHDNTITDCGQPVVLDSHGSDTSLFRDNIITCGDTANVTQAIEVHGRFQLIDNHIVGVDEKAGQAVTK